MADPPEGLLGRLFPGNDPAALYGGALTDPATQAQLNQRGLLAMAGSFADSAMPTRMPTPLGAVLGHAAAALGSSGDAVMDARLKAAQSQQALAQSQLVQQRVGLLGSLPNDLQNYYTPDSGGGIPSAPAPGAPGAPGTVGTTTAGKPPTGPIDPELVTWWAKYHGLDPLLAHATMDIESSYGTNTGNTISPSNTGAFQRAPADKPGGMNDSYGNQVALGTGDLAREKADLAARLGREPTNAEVYLAHQQGADGAAKLINNPDTPAGKLVRPVNISNNGGARFVDQPASAFVNHWADVYAKREAKFAPLAASLPPGGGAPPKPVQMAQANPGTMSDASPAPPGAGAPVRPSEQTTGLFANQPLPGAAAPPAPPGLLEPQQGPTPPPGAPSPAVPPPPGAGQTAAAPPGLLNASPNIPPPPPTPVPPIARPQVAAPGAAPGAIPGAPSPAKIHQAQIIAYKMGLAGLPIPPDIEATAKFGLEIAKATGTAAATYPYDLGKAVAPQTERGEQARITYGDELVNIPGYGWVQRKNLPGFRIAGSGGTAGSTALPQAPTPGAPAPAAPTSPGVILPSENPAQTEVFKANLAAAAKQLEPYQVDKNASMTQIGTADSINDLLKRTTLGWGANTRQEAGMILKALGSSDETVNKLLSVDTTAGGTLSKLFLQYTADAVRTMGAREPGSVISLFAAAYPNLESDPRAAELMTNALRMQAQWKFDRANAAEEWNAKQQQNAGPFGQNYRGLNGFEPAFAKTNGFHDYWRAAAAMSGFPDIAWKGTSEADQHRIYALIPAGRMHVAPNGQAFPKPGAQ